MGVDYSFGSGYGIAIPLEDDVEEKLIEALNDFYGTSVSVDGGIHEFGGEPKLGPVETYWTGNMWTGENFHALLIQKGTGQHNRLAEIGGVRVFEQEPFDSVVFEDIAEHLTRAGIHYTEPGWVQWVSVT